MDGPPAPRCTANPEALCAGMGQRRCAFVGGPTDFYTPVTFSRQRSALTVVAPKTETRPASNHAAAGAEGRCPSPARFSQLLTEAHPVRQHAAPEHRDAEVGRLAG